MSIAFDWRSSAEMLRSMAERSVDRELVASLHRLAGEYETKAAAHDIISKAYVIKPTSVQSEQTALEIRG